MNINNNDLLNMKVDAHYKSRIPDPGVCRIVSINWERRDVSMTNGSCRYLASFDEIDILRYQV